MKPLTGIEYNGFISLKTNESPEPLADIAVCCVCEWKGDISICEIATDGDWETGYYMIHLCPICEDGGCIDEYDRSAKNIIAWEEWRVKKGGI